MRLEVHCSCVLIWLTSCSWNHSLNCLISSRDHVRIVRLSIIFGRVMSLVISIVGAQAVHVVLKVAVGAVTLPVVVGWVVSVVTATSCADSAVTRATATVASRCVAVLSAITSWAPVCGVAACSPAVTCPQDPRWSGWCFTAVNVGKT